MGIIYKLSLLTALFGLMIKLLQVSCYDTTNLSPYEVISSWKSIDYKFPSPHTRVKFLQTGKFIPENNVLAGIKIYKTRAYLTTPRLRTGVPSTLNYINLNSFDKSQLLIPYPSLKMNAIGNCNALQFVQSMEIDRWGRMWIIDLGRENILGTGRILHKYEFPDIIVNHQTNFINDIVVECHSDLWRCWAYITDAWDAKLVIYSLEEDRSWFVKNPQSMEADPKATMLTILGINYTFNMSINGIALSPLTPSNHDRLYYTPLTGYSIYSVSTSTLKQAFITGQTNLPNSDITRHANKRPSQTGGIMMDSTGLLFVGQLQNNAVSYFNTSAVAMTHGSNEIFKDETLLIQNDEQLQWPDTFAFDKHGYLWLVTCRMNRFFTSTMNFHDINFKIVRVFVGSRSYMY